MFFRDGGPVVGQEAAENRDVRVVQYDFEAGRDHVFAGGQGLKPGLDHALIGPHKAARAQLDAAEIACDHGAEFAYAAVEQHGQHGTSGGAVRFAVIAVAHLSRRAGRARGVRPAIVRGVGEFPLDALNERLGRFGVRRMGEADDKAAAADAFLAAVQGLRFEIGDSIRDGHEKEV